MFEFRLNNYENGYFDRPVHASHTTLLNQAITQFNYFVKDGHHRISVARALGESAIDAEIIIWDVSCDLAWEPQTTPDILPQTA